MADNLSHEERLKRARLGGEPVRGVPTRETGDRRWYWLLTVPFFGTFFPWIYNTTDPELFGLPFFYWYQLAWVPITVVLTIFVYRATRARP